MRMRYAAAALAAVLLLGARPIGGRDARGYEIRYIITAGGDFIVVGKHDWWWVYHDHQCSNKHATTPRVYPHERVVVYLCET